MPARRLLLALAVSLCVTASALAGPAVQARPADAPAPTATSVSARASTVPLRPALKRVLVKVNKARKRHGLKPLRVTRCLTTKVAQPWARHMARTEQMVHQDLSKVFKVCTNLSRVGENIAYGYTSAASVMTAWMHSPGHRANILNKRFTKIGLGLARSSDGTRYWAQDFGG
jgi:uncharacterized protein YkwD